MKKWFVLFSGIFLFATMIMLHSCSSDEPTVGILVIKIIDAKGHPLMGEQVFLADSYKNLLERNYYRNAWTNEEGFVLFMDLPPTYFWYDTEHWEDWGAIQTYAGIEQFVTLQVNTPQP